MPHAAPVLGGQNDLICIVGHLLAGAIETASGLLLVPAGTRLGLTHLEKLRNFARLGGIREPISVVAYL